MIVDPAAAVAALRQRSVADAGRRHANEAPLPSARDHGHGLHRRLMRSARLQFPNFASTRVVGNLLTDNAFLGIVAVGMTFVIISGGIDLSVGSVIGFTGVFLALAIERLGMQPLLAFVAIAADCAPPFGAAMGAIIHYLRDAALHRHAGGHVPGARRRFLMSTDSIADQRAALFDSVGFRTAPARRRPADADRPAHARGLRGGRRAAALHPLRRQCLCARRQPRIDGPDGRAGRRARRCASTCCRASWPAWPASCSRFYTSAGYSLAAVGVELDAIAAVVIGGTLLTGG